MREAGPIIKFSVFAVVMASVAAGLVIVFGHIRFDSDDEYHAVFADVSGLRTGEFVRIAGVEIGQISDVAVLDDSKAAVTFTVRQGIQLSSATKASVRWANLIGAHYLELTEGPGGTPLPEGGEIPVENTEPALDLDALLGGFKPLFKALDPDQVNRLSSSLIAVFQGQGGSVADILQQTAQLTSTLADRDQLIGAVVENFNTVLQTVDDHNVEFSNGLDDLQQLIGGLAQKSVPIAESLAHINNASQSVADLLGQSRADIVNDVREIDRVATQVISDKDYVDAQLRGLPTTYQGLTRLGLYGDFFSFYFCDATIKVNGPNGDPVYIPIIGQRAGRCTA